MNGSSENGNNESTMIGELRDLAMGMARMGAKVMADVMMIVALAILIVHLLVMILAIAMLRDVIEITDGRVRKSSGGGVEYGRYGSRETERLTY